MGFRHGAPGTSLAEILKHNLTSEDPLQKSPRRPYIIGVLSDMHLSIIHKPTLSVCEEWCADVRPDELLINGDTFDFAALSSYPKGADILACAVEEVKLGVQTLNRLHRYTPKIRVVWGNHCKRWERTVIGPNAQALRGAVGLTLKEQCAFHGLDPRVEWTKETARTPGLWVTSSLVARHGDLQAQHNANVLNIATSRLARNQGVSELVGHHHKAQLAYRTAWDRTSFVMSLPTMADSEDYAPAADWQRGWGVLTLHYAPRKPGKKTPPPVVQPSLVVVQNGIAMWGGKTYGTYSIRG